LSEEIGLKKEGKVALEEKYSDIARISRGKDIGRNCFELIGRIQEKIILTKILKDQVGGRKINISTTIA
jgi:hypothetical protein